MKTRSLEKRQHRLLLSLCIFGVLICGSIGLYLSKISLPLSSKNLSENIRVFQKSQSLPPNLLADIDDFLITGEQGIPKWTVVFFGYTRCPEVCPTSLAFLTQEINNHIHDNKDYRYLFITLDTEHDTPEVMGNYISHFSPSIEPVILPPDVLESFANFFFDFDSFKDRNDAISKSHSSLLATRDLYHSERLYVFNPHLDWAGYYITRPQSGDIAKDLSTLVELKNDRKT